MYLRHPSLLAALVCFVTAAAPASAVADSSARANTLHDLATRIHAAADEVSEAHNRHRAATDVATTLATLRGAFDAATHANMPGRAHADGIFANKLRELAPLLAGIERASRTKPVDNLRSLIPAHLPPALRGRFGAIDERHGGTCGHAFGLAGCA